MEHSTDLLTGFVKHLKILDKEFRSTQAAVEYTEGQIRDSQPENRKQSGEKVRKVVSGGKSRSESQAREYEKQTAAVLEKYSGGKKDTMERLTECQLLYAAARNAGNAIVCAQEVAQGAPSRSASVRLEDLLSGSTDLYKLVENVNREVRAGRMSSAKTAWASFDATRREAERLLDEEIVRLQAELFTGRESRTEDCLGCVEKYTNSGASALGEYFVRTDGLADELARDAKAADAKAARELTALKAKRADRTDRITSAFLGAYMPVDLAEGWERSCAAEPDLTDFRCPVEMPEKLCLAGAEYHIAGMDLREDTQRFLEKYYPFLCRGGSISMPCGLDLNGDGAYEFRYTANHRPRAVRQARNIAMRMLTLMPAGKLKITFADPVNLGESFAMFGRLSDPETGDSGMIDGKIWSSPTDIEKKLLELTQHIADINQRCLQGRYQSLAQYNRESGRAPEGCRVVMLMDYPAGMTEQALKYLDQIARQGPKCGVFPILYRSEEQQKKLPDKLRPTVSNLRAGFRLLSFADDGQIAFDLPKQYGRSFVWRDKPAPDASQMDGVIRAMKLGI